MELPAQHRVDICVTAIVSGNTSVFHCQGNVSFINYYVYCKQETKHDLRYCDWAASSLRAIRTGFGTRTAVGVVRMQITVLQLGQRFNYPG